MNGTGFIEYKLKKQFSILRKTKKKAKLLERVIFWPYFCFPLIALM